MNERCGTGLLIVSRARSLKLTDQVYERFDSNSFDVLLLFFSKRRRNARP